MDNYISYLTGYVDALDKSPLVPGEDTQDEIAVMEAKLNADISMFDATRKSYLADLNKLRDVYRPIFENLLKSIKEERTALEKLTGSKVTFHE